MTEYPVALVDGDILAYRIGFASEDISERFAVARLRKTIQKYAHLEAGGLLCEVFLTGSTNFRNDLAVTKPYKGNRSAPKPKHFLALRKAMLDDGACLSIGCEADDMIGIRSQELGAGNCVVVGLDKDLLNLPGIHYNFVKREFIVVDEEQALLNFYRQVVTGDSVDNVAGMGRGAKAFAAKMTKGMNKDELEDIAVCGFTKGFIPSDKQLKKLKTTVTEPMLREAQGKARSRVDENKGLLWILHHPLSNGVGAIKVEAR